MQLDQISHSKTYRVAAFAGIAAVFASTITALTVIFLLRWRRTVKAERQDELQVEEVPIQPALNTTAPAQMPDHFSEDLLVPRHTYTGGEIAEQDDREGRSPEGV